MDRRRRNAFRRRLERHRDELSALLAKAQSESRGLGARKTGDEGERAARSYHRDLLHFQSDTGRLQLRLVLDALRRTRTEEFGICEECGRPIGLKRLKAVPWTPYCRDCQEELESQDGTPGER